jgi:Asp/Glu/hydantoin racemase
VLKPNEAMLEEALAAGTNLALITTFEPSIPSLMKEFEELASSRGIRLKLKTRTVPAAIAALQRGHVSEHDSLIAAAAAEMGHCDALVLGQFSMARAASGIPKAPGRKVLTSPHSAVTRLMRIFDAR